jgi:hypothetical protein
MMPMALQMRAGVLEQLHLCHIVKPYSDPSWSNFLQVQIILADCDSRFSAAIWYVLDSGPELLDCIVQSFCHLDSLRT